jgi:K+-transporting ATPase ATPase C chain
MNALFTSIRAILLFTVLTGLAYPLLVLTVGKTLFPHQAGGSLILRDGKPAGSTLIGQHMDQPDYFWPRPSATGPTPYNALASSGSNLGPMHPDLKKPVPGMPRDLYTASGSGLDPHISPDAARYQIPRVSHARNLSPEQLATLVDRFTEHRQLAILGEERVNVLLLNQALDGRF